MEQSLPKSSNDLELGVYRGVSPSLNQGGVGARTVNPQTDSDESTDSRWNLVVALNPLNSADSVFLLLLSPVSQTKLRHSVVDASPKSPQHSRGRFRT